MSTSAASPPGPRLYPAGWQIPEAISRRLGAKVGRQRAMFADGHLLLVLHLPPAADEFERRPRFFWRNPEGQWQSSDVGAGISGLAKHLDQFSDALARLDRLEEQAASAHEYFDVLEEVMPLTRATQHLHQVLQEARQQVPDDRDIINARDRAYEIERASEILEQQLQHRLNYAIARRGEEQAEAGHQLAAAAHRLNLLAALFLPLATICAIFGMEIDHGLRGPFEPQLFAGIVGFGLASGIALMWFISRGFRERRRRND